MALSDVALGVGNSIKEQLAQRLQQQQLERQMAQQQFQNQMAEQQQAGMMEDRAFTRERLAQGDANDAYKQQADMANVLGDQLPAGAELDEQDPAVGLMRAGGRGGLLRTRGIDAQAPPAMLQAPGEDQPEELPGTMPASPMPGAPRMVIKSASANQANTAEDNRRAAETAAQNSPEAKFEQFTRQEDYKRRNAPPVQGPVSPDAKFESWKRQYDYEVANPKKPAGAEGGPSPYMTERNARNLQSVDELSKKINRWTTGAGSLLASLPETDARNFAAELDTLKANIAFGELTAMREASKTGGALGQVSERELALLTATLGALDPGQSPANLKAQLEKVKASIQRWQAASSGLASPGRTGGTPDGGGVALADPLGLR